MVFFLKLRYVISELYGPKYVQAIHGRFLVAASLSTIIGPSLLLNLRKIAESSAIQGIVNCVYILLSVIYYIHHTLKRTPWKLSLKF